MDSLLASFSPSEDIWLLLILFLEPSWSNSTTSNYGLFVFILTNFIFHIERVHFLTLKLYL